MDKQNVHAVTPSLTAEEACSIVKRYYGWDVDASEVKSLPSYEDQNFRLHPKGHSDEYVFKITRSDASEDVLRMQNNAMDFINDRIGEKLCPTVQRTLEGETLFTVECSARGERTTHFARAVTFMKGSIMAHATKHSSVFEFNFGRFIGRLDSVLQRFCSKAAQERELKYWDLKYATPVAALTHCIRDEKRRAIVDRIFKTYQEEVLPRLQHLRQSVIHNDANDFNVLVRENDEMRPLVGPSDIVAIIDFGDMVHTYTICELAIGCAYAAQRKIDPLRSAAHIVAGYHSQMPLLEPELELLYDLMRVRVAVSVTMSATSQIASPDNPYLAVSEEPGWRLLERLEPVHRNCAHYLFRQACGFDAHPDTVPLKRVLQRHLRADNGVIAPVVDIDFRHMKAEDQKRVYVFDLDQRGDSALFDGSVAEESSPKDTHTMQREFFAEIENAGAEVGIGRYNENRDIYRGSAFHDHTSAEAEIPFYDMEPIDSRVVHIGLDVFLEPLRPVFAVVRGKVHSFANNAKKYDYGPCIILEHTLDGVDFYTLYGHLSVASLEGLYVGKVVEAGDKIGEIGAYPENGDWPTHLHFQVLLDMLGLHGDFPGVVRRTQRSMWLDLCPDPNLLLGIPEEWLGIYNKTWRAVKLGDDGMSKEAIEHFRRDRLSSALSISYDTPLQIYRGFMQYLFDENGREYLDCVNNVCHVGHCNPRVTRTISMQASLLATNTRYLHDYIVTYADKIVRTMRGGDLSVCFFVCSGTEANDLACRLARAYTGKKGMICVEGGYHGHSSRVIEVSPYKFNGSGGEGVQPHVIAVSTPDTYRGKHRRSDPEAGKKYAQEVAQAAEELNARGDGVAAFFCESVLSCAGQIVLPPGYLSHAYESVRSAGGVCIADEVQVGFARVGSAYWGYQLQSVIPDIVTLGKPIGNGFPMAAVVTTPAIARAFENGMEYFNTFGGNTLACAVGSTVMDVIFDNALQPKARKTGDYLLQELQKLQDKYSLIGDVRGVGLFVGIELVRDRETLEPAAKEAHWLVNEMKEEGVLLSTDGPLKNVIKMKPPLVFTCENADTVVLLLDKCLAAMPALE